MGKTEVVRTCQAMIVRIRLDHLRFNICHLRDYPLLVAQIADIQRLYKAHERRCMPLPWPVTRELVTAWDQGAPTPLYERWGIYRPESSME